MMKLRILFFRNVSEWKKSCLFHQGSLVLDGCHARVFLERGVKPGYGIEPGVDRQLQYRNIRFGCIQLLHHIIDTSTVYQVVKRLTKCMVDYIGNLVSGVPELF